VPKGRNDYLKVGDYNTICDVCGFKFKASMLKDRWDGLKVCDADWETRHPQDLLRNPDPEKAIPWARPDTPITSAPEQNPTYADTGQDDTPTGTFNGGGTLSPL
jgi:hypothetical protein